MSLNLDGNIPRSRSFNNFGGGIMAANGALAGSGGTWVITPEERAAHTNMFMKIGPVNGKLSGEQARAFFMKTNLPKSVLAHIWSLSDIDQDGSLDANEFVLSMHLINSKLRGQELPATLPDSLRTLAPTVPTLGPIPAADRLRYNQEFNQHDYRRQGVISGTQARQVFTMQSRLPQLTLAQIWQLADVDRDGALNREEYALAKHLVGAAMQGIPLPATLPLFLQPARAQPTGASEQGAGVDREAQRLENFRAGQEELERRRRLVEDEERRSREESERRHQLEEQRRKEARERVLREEERRRMQEMEMMRRQQEAMALQQRAAAEQQEKERQAAEAEMRRMALVQQDLCTRRDELRRACDQMTVRMALLTAQLERLEGRRTDLDTMVLQVSSEGSASVQAVQQLQADVARREAEVSALATQLPALNSALHSAMDTRTALTHQLLQLREAQGRSGSGIQEVQAGRQTLQSIGMLQASLDASNTTLDTQRSALQTLQSTLLSLHSELDTSRHQRSIVAREAELMAMRRKEAMERMEQEQRRVQEQRQAEADRERQQREDRRRSAQFTADLVRRDHQNTMQDINHHTQRTLSATSVAAVVAGSSTPQPSTVPLVSTPAATLAPPGHKVKGHVRKRSSASGPALPAAMRASRAAPPEQDQDAVVPELAEPEEWMAMYDFKGPQADDLPLRAGEVLTVTCKDGEGWWYGRKGGQAGWFPQGYVDRMPSGQDLREDESDDDEAVPLPPPPPVDEQQPEQPPNTSGGERHLALYSYQSRQAGDLTFGAGDRIVVYEKGEDGWWRGERDGYVGWFPGNYVNPVPETMQDTGPMEFDEPAAQGIFQRQASVQSLVSAHSTHSAVAASDWVTALYSYTGQQEDELSFREGDVFVLQQKDDTAGWWQGTHNGKTGWFPASYVTINGVERSSKHRRKPSLNPFMGEEGATDSSEAGLGPLPDASQVPKLKEPCIAKAMEDYEGGGERLSLKRNALVAVTCMHASGWWLGELSVRGAGKKVGWFPATAVKLLEKTAKTGPKDIGGVSIESLGPTPPSVPTARLGRVVAVFGYKALHGDELTFHEGDVISVVAKPEQDWWLGSINGSVGLFPVSYVTPAPDEPPTPTQTQPPALDRTLRPMGTGRVNMVVDDVAWANMVAPEVASELGLEEKKRQQLIFELITTEQAYVMDLEVVMEVFYRPMQAKNLLTRKELQIVFINWEDLLRINTLFLEQLLDRQAAGNMVVSRIGALLASQLEGMDAYAVFCSLQSDAITFLGQNTSTLLKEFFQSCSKDPRTHNMPLSSFLLKPMQRVTRYPLLIRKMLHYTPPGHPDHDDMVEAVDRAEQLAQNINEVVKRRENDRKMAEIQSALHCDALSEDFVLRSETACLGPREYLHEGLLMKRSKELYAFLFNDILLLTIASKNRGKLMGVGTRSSSITYTLYKPPIPLNAVAVREVPKTKDKPTPDEAAFQLVHIQKIHTFRAVDVREKKLWMEKIADASYQYIECERTLRVSSRPNTNFVATLCVTLVEATDLQPDAKGRRSPYCTVKLGTQQMNTKIIKSTTSPRWQSEMVLGVADFNDPLRITVRDYGTVSAKDEELGYVHVSIAGLQDGQEKDYTLPLEGGRGTLVLSLSCRAMR